MEHDDRHRATSRRRILTARAATAGGAALLPRYGLQAQQAPTTRRLVDTHHHYYPREIIDAWQGYMTRNSEGRLQPNVANWAPAASLEEMDKSGVGTSILSLASIPGLWFGLDPPDAPDVTAVQRIRGEDGPGSSGPLWALRFVADAGC